MAKRKWPMLRSWKAGVLVTATTVSLVSGLTLYLYKDSAGKFLATLWKQTYADVLDLARSQPEVVSSVEEYIKLRVTPTRIETGREKAVEWQTTIADIEKKYGVPAKTLLAIWGVESNFGKNMGDHNVLGSLA